MAQPAPKRRRTANAPPTVTPLRPPPFESFCEVVDVFTLFARFLSPADLFRLWCCGRTARKCTLPVLTRGVVWMDGEVRQWATATSYPL